MTRPEIFPIGQRGAARQPTSSVLAAYERYFRSGSYEARYPQPNPTVLSCIRSHLPKGGHVIDFGCGSGRYLFALRQDVGRAAGFDVSRAALERLAQHAGQANWPHLSILGPDRKSLSAHIAKHGGADIVLCLFGVLGHITSEERRYETLRYLSRLLKPRSGRLVLSVPNRWRRFYAEQRRAGPAQPIRYLRHMDGEAVEMRYQLFGPRLLCAELARAGLAVEALMAESVLSESAVSRNAAARALDRVVSPLAPASTGYGLLAVVAPKRTAGA